MCESDCEARELHFEAEARELPLGPFLLVVRGDGTGPADLDRRGLALCRLIRGAGYPVEGVVVLSPGVEFHLLDEADMARAGWVRAPA